MPDFFQTIMGKRFLEGTMPRIASALERIAEALEKNLEEPTSPKSSKTLIIDELCKPEPDAVRSAKSAIVRDFAERHGVPVVDIPLSESPFDWEASQVQVSTVQDWLEYARGADIHGAIISFLEEYPEYYVYRHPRSWGLLSNSLKLVDASPDLGKELEEIVATYLGRTYLTFKFVRFYLKEPEDESN